MASAPETLRTAIASMTEAEASQTLAYIHRLRERPSPPDLYAVGIAKLLSGHPQIHVPPDPFQPLPPFEPIAGTGIPASELLIRDRR